jgi:hypothetical protein
MDPVSENNSSTAVNAARDFPFEALDRTKALAPETDTASVYTAESYDNRAQISELASSLTSKLDSFAQTLSASFFISESFSWLTMTAQTSDSGIAVATAYADAEEDVWLLNTQELAKTRAHTTVSLSAADRTDFETDTYEFDLTVGEEVYGIDLTIENDDTDPLTNHEMLLRLERAFNSSGADVSASVSTTYEKVYSSYYSNYGLEEVSFLQLVSGDSGKDESFSVEDTSGEIISKLGLDQTLEFGRNSEYTIDGDEFEFYSNTIEVDGDAVQAYLTGESEESELTQLEAKYGIEAVAESVTNVIGEYNDLIEWIDENDYFISNSLKKALFEELNSAVLETRTVSYGDNSESESFAVVQGGVKIYDNAGFFPQLNGDIHPTVESEMADIGLTLNSDGTLDMDTDFQAYFKSRFKEIHDTLAGDDGFFTKIGEALEEIRSETDDRYVYSKNHVLVYSTDAGTEAKKIYQENVSTLINTFA